MSTTALNLYRPEHCCWDPNTQRWFVEVKFLGGVIRCEGVNRESLCEFVNASIAGHTRTQNRHAMSLPDGDANDDDAP